MYTVTHIFTRFLPFQNQHRTSLSPTSRVRRTKNDDSFNISSHIVRRKEYRTVTTASFSQ